MNSSVVERTTHLRKRKATERTCKLAPGLDAAHADISSSDVHPAQARNVRLAPPTKTISSKEMEVAGSPEGL